MISVGDETVVRMFAEVLVAPAGLPGLSGDPAAGAHPSRRPSLGTTGFGDWIWTDGVAE
jgi:hypothetical protein